MQAVLQADAIDPFQLGYELVDRLPGIAGNVLQDVRRQEVADWLALRANLDIVLPASLFQCQVTSPAWVAPNGLVGGAVSADQFAQVNAAAAAAGFEFELALYSANG